MHVHVVNLNVTLNWNCVNKKGKKYHQKYLKKSKNNYIIHNTKWKHLKSISQEKQNSKYVQCYVSDILVSFWFERNGITTYIQYIYNKHYIMVNRNWNNYIRKYINMDTQYHRLVDNKCRHTFSETAVYTIFLAIM